MIKIERMKKGYEISIKNLEASLKENKPDAYVARRKEVLSTTEYKKFDDFIWDPWVRFGACFSFVFHPVMGYKTIKLGLKYQGSCKCSCKPNNSQ